MANHPAAILSPRPLAVRTAVVGFFALGIIGSLGGLSPGTCCRRAVLGAAIVYFVTGAVVRAVNAILTQAMITDHIRKENSGGNRG
jgi:uncharacterized membrane protein YjjP (DUF1212 family)